MMARHVPECPSCLGPDYVPHDPDECARRVRIERDAALEKLRELEEQIEITYHNGRELVAQAKRDLHACELEIGVLRGAIAELVATEQAPPHVLGALRVILSTPIPPLVEEVEELKDAAAVVCEAEEKSQVWTCEPRFREFIGQLRVALTTLRKRGMGG